MSYAELRKNVGNVVFEDGDIIHDVDVKRLFAYIIVIMLSSVMSLFKTSVLRKPAVLFTFGPEIHGWQNRKSVDTSGGTLKNITAQQVTMNEYVRDVRFE